MTAPDTNTKKQAKRHIGPLVGMAVGVGLVLVLLFWMFGRTLSESEEAEQAPPETVEEPMGVPAEGSVSGPADTGPPQIEEISPEPAD